MRYSLLSKEYYKDRQHYEQLYQQRFENESTLHLSMSINGTQAFMTYPPELLELVAKIYKGDKILSEKLHRLPELASLQFMKKCLVEEIQLTNEIEGVHSTHKEICEVLHSKEKGKRLYGIVCKYNMLRQGIEIPMMSCGDIRSLYDDLVLPEVLEEDVRNVPDGIIFRKDSVSVQGADLQIVHTGINPEEQIISYMDQCIRLIQNGEINGLISIALVHYFIGYIHPFYDGNGRLVRFISSYLLTKELNPIVAFHLSYVIKKELKEYHKSFKITNEKKNRGDVTPFVIMFLNFVLQAVNSLNKIIDSKTEQFSYYQENVKEVTNDPRLYRMLYILILNTLFGDEGIDVDKIAQLLNMSTPSVRKYIASVDKSVLWIGKSGHKNIYNLNLEYFN